MAFAIVAEPKWKLMVITNKRNAIAEWLETGFEINFIVNGTIKTLYYRKFIIQVNVFFLVKTAEEEWEKNTDKEKVRVMHWEYGIYCNKFAVLSP